MEPLTRPKRAVDSPTDSLPTIRLPAEGQDLVLREHGVQLSDAGGMLQSRSVQWLKPAPLNALPPRLPPEGSGTVNLRSQL